MSDESKVYSGEKFSVYSILCFEIREAIYSMWVNHLASNPTPRCLWVRDGTIGFPSNWKLILSGGILLAANIISLSFSD